MINPRSAAFHIEAKKHAVRQTADGWVISFVVHPSDVRADFAVAPLGTRYMIALCEIGSDEQPVSNPPSGSAERPAVTHTPAQQGGGAHQPRQSFRSLPPEKQAGILAKDPRFQQWATSKRLGVPVREEHDAAEFIRQPSVNPDLEANPDAERPAQEWLRDRLEGIQASGARA